MARRRRVKHQLLSATCGEARSSVSASDARYKEERRVLVEHDVAITVSDPGGKTGHR